MAQPPVTKGFRPIGTQGRAPAGVNLLFEEYEAVKLCDYDGLTQAQAAKVMGVSRPTITRIYGSARRKIAVAIVENRSIFIDGGHVDFRESWFRCDDCHAVFSSVDGDSPKRCPHCFSESISPIKPLETMGYGRKRAYDVHNREPKYCSCPDCGFKISHKRGVPCRDVVCPQCGQSLVRDDFINDKKNSEMKIAISCSGDNPGANFNAKFGRAPYFAIVENDNVVFEKNPAAEADSGAGPMAVEFLIGFGVKKVVSGHFGPKAETALKAAGIEFETFGDEDKTIDEIKNNF